MGSDCCAPPRNKTDPSPNFQRKVRIIMGTCSSQKLRITLNNLPRIPTLESAASSSSTMTITVTNLDGDAEPERRKRLSSCWSGITLDCNTMLMDYLEVPLRTIVT